MTERPSTIQLSHLEQTVCFAAQRQGANLLDTDAATHLAGVSRLHGSTRWPARPARASSSELDEGDTPSSPPSILHERKSYVTDLRLVIDELMRADGLQDRYYVAYQSAAAIY